jgi:hypothetical protein
MTCILAAHMCHLLFPPSALRSGAALCLLLFLWGVCACGSAFFGPLSFLVAGRLNVERSPHMFLVGYWDATAAARFFHANPGPMPHRRKDGEALVAVVQMTSRPWRLQGSTWALQVHGNMHALRFTVAVPLGV